MAPIEDLRTRIVAKARSRVGVPWQHQGRSAEGLDCVGLVSETAREIGFSAFDLHNYDRLPDGVELLRLCDENARRIPVRDMQPGDMVVLQFAGKPSHIGILGDYRWGGLSLIHANTLIGKVVEHRLSPDWRAKIVAAYGPPEA